MRYTRKQHSVIDAIEWTGENLKDVQAFMFPASPLDHANNRLGINVYAAAEYGGTSRLTFIEKGQYIVRDEAGHFFTYVTKDFEAQFEPAPFETYDVGVHHEDVPATERVPL